MDILLLEAYYGGSHKLWADQLKQFSQHHIEIISLPSRHWKWRMEGAAIEFSKMVQSRSNRPDLIIGTSMLDMSFLKANLPKGWNDIPSLYYMHENQFSYPKSNHDLDAEKGRDFHYGMIQFKSMLSANQTCFNSDYHKQVFFEHLRKLISRLPDFQPLNAITELEQNSKVLPLGIRDTRLERKINKAPIILWNHRWEYDKNPKLFFEALIALASDHDFQLIVLGSKARTYPAIFDEAQKELSDRIIHWGYVEDRTHYDQLLNQADLLPVTSHQDFFGISIMESVLAGATPILPNRLVYPEHFSLEEHGNLYYNKDQDFFDLLKSHIQNPIEETQKKSLINKAKEYLWSTQIKKYDQFFESQLI